VRDLVATRARARRRRRRDEPAHGGGRAPISPAPTSPEGVRPGGAASPASGEPAVHGHRPSAGDAERRLDRLLRSFQR
jgi:hypothetical protein